MWEAVRDNATAVEVACLSGGGQGVNLFADGAVLFVRQGRVSAGFSMARIAPLIGREFSHAEDTAASAQWPSLATACGNGCFVAMGSRCRLFF